MIGLNYIQNCFISAIYCFAHQKSEEFSKDKRFLCSLRGKVDLAGLSTLGSSKCSNFNSVLWFTARSRRISLNSGADRWAPLNCFSFVVCSISDCFGDSTSSATCLHLHGILHFERFSWTFPNGKQRPSQLLWSNCRLFIRTRKSTIVNKNEIFKLPFNCCICTSASRSWIRPRKR